MHYHHSNFFCSVEADQQCRIAKKVVGDRFGDKKVVRDDMLGTFVRNGLDQRQAESEILTTMYVLLMLCLARGSH